MKNNIVLNNKVELERFLKLVAQESVKKSLRESDQHVDLYNQQKKNDAKSFSALKEESEEKEAGSEEQQALQQSTDRKDLKNNNANVVKDITPRMVMSQINNIRAGLSLKNKEIKENLITFLEKLDENEVLVLFYYLEDISKILNQKIKGQDAFDPSDDPLNISMTRSSKKEDDRQAVVKAPNKKSLTSKKETEDTSPPISVNERQNKDDIRRKIRILMS